MKINKLIAELEKIEDKEQEIAVYCSVDNVVVTIVGVEMRKNDETDKDVLCVLEEF